MIISVTAQRRNASVWKQGMKFLMRLVLVHAGREDLTRALEGWERSNGTRTLLRIMS